MDDMIDILSSRKMHMHSVNQLGRVMSKADTLFVGNFTHNMVVCYFRLFVWLFVWHKCIERLTILAVMTCLSKGSHVTWDHCYWGLTYYPQSSQPANYMCKPDTNTIHTHTHIHLFNKINYYINFIHQKYMEEGCLVNLLCNFQHKQILILWLIQE